MITPTIVLIEHEGEWFPGTLRSTNSAPDGTLTFLVTWRRIPDGQIRIDRFPASRVAI